MYQQITLIGRLGKDPELRITAGEIPVCNFPLAVQRKWTGRDGEPMEKTTWFRITAWRRLAETANQYLVKGRQVMVVGEVEPVDVFSGRDGEPVATLDVTAHVIQFLDAPDSQETDEEKPRPRRRRQQEELQIAIPF